MPLFSAGGGGVLACVPVVAEMDGIVDGPFDENCSSCCVSSFPMSDLALELGSLSVTLGFHVFPCWNPLVFLFLLVSSISFDPLNLSMYVLDGYQRPLHR